MYIPESIQSEQDYKDCVAFHGHTCMGVTIGYLAAKCALDILENERSVDEELITIVENDACCCDAIQLLTGCTFGKGNFFFKDHGKMAFTFGSRATKRSVRLLLRQDIFEIPEREQELAEKIRNGKAGLDEIKEYEKMSETRAEKLFARGPAAFFDIEHLDLDLPPTAARAQSSPCDQCGEMVMQTKLENIQGKMVCKGCGEKVGLLGR